MTPDSHRNTQQDLFYIELFEPTVDGLVDFLQSKERMNAFATTFAKAAAMAGAEKIREDTEKDRFVRRLLIADRMEKKLPLSDDDVAFAAEILRTPGQPSEERRRAGRPATADRRILVGLLVFCCVTLGLRPFRDEMAAPDTACDVVANAFRRLGKRPTTYSGVKAAYIEFRKSVDLEWPEKS